MIARDVARLLAHRFGLLNHRIDPCNPLQDGKLGYAT